MIEESAVSVLKRAGVRASCPACPEVFVIQHIGTDPGRYAQQKLDTALNEHLRTTHGLMSVLIAESERDEAAASAFVAGQEQQRMKQAGDLRSVLADALRAIVNGDL